MPKGGRRPGSGRKKLHDEILARDMAISAIEKVYGSIEEGMQALLRSGEQSLIKFVFEHAVGKPKEKVEHSTDPEAPVIFKLDDRFVDSD